MESSSSELENLCRTCMSTRNFMNIGSKCMRSIYNKPSGCSDGPTIMELLHSVQPQIGIDPNDKLPKLICLGCVEHLQITYEFLQMSSNADLKFRKLLKEVEVDEEGPVEYQHLEYPGEVLPFVPIKEENIEDDVCRVGATTYGIQKQEYGLAPELPFNQPPPFEELFFNKRPDEEDELEYCDNNDGNASYDDDDNDGEDGAWTSMDISKSKWSNKTFPAETKGNSNKFDDYLKLPPAPNDNGQIPCQDCEELLENLTLWREHMLGHKSGKIRRKSGPKKSTCQRFICEDCGLVFDRRRPFRKHELTHPGKSKRDRKAITRNMRRENALRRMTGQEYLGYTTSGGMWAADSPKAGRQLRPTCQSNACIRSRDRYCQSFDEETRKNIFQKFWTYTWEEKSSFVNDNAFLIDTKRCTVKNSRKKYTFVYQLPMDNEKLHVCRTMFLATLCISKAMVRRWLMNDPAKKSSSSLSNNQESNDSCEMAEIIN